MEHIGNANITKHLNGEPIKITLRFRLMGGAFAVAPPAMRSYTPNKLAPATSNMEARKDIFFSLFSLTNKQTNRIQLAVAPQRKRLQTLVQTKERPSNAVMGW